MDATEKFVDSEILDGTLLPSQRNTDVRLEMDNLGEVKASPQQKMDNKEEEPFMLMYAHLMPMVKSPDPESDEDELSSSEEIVNKEFKKMKFLNKFHAGISQLITKLLE